MKSPHPSPRRIPLCVTCLAWALAAPLAATAQAPSDEAAEPRVLTIDDYALWRSVDDVEIAADGSWAGWVYEQREVDDTLYLRDLQSGEEQVVGRASSPTFSDDGRWVAYAVSPSVEEIERLEAEGEPVRRAAELRDLATGETWRWENVSTFGFAPRSSRTFVVRKLKSDQAMEHDGTDLIVRHLDAGFEELLGSVGDYAFDEPGAWLAYTVDAPDRDGNGVYVLNLESRRRRALDNANADYARLTWEEEGGGLAVLRGDEVDGFVERENVLLAFRELSDEGAERFELDVTGPVADGGADGEASTDRTGDGPGLPPEMVVSEKANLSWSPDLRRVFFGVRPQQVDAKRLCEIAGRKGEAADTTEAEEGAGADARGMDAPDGAPDGDERDTAGPEDDDRSAAESEDDASAAQRAALAAADADPVLEDPLICSDVDVANVDIWHGADDRIQSVQESQAGSDRDRTWRAVFHLESGDVVQLADSVIRSVDVTRDGRWAIGADRTPYISDWKPRYADYVRIDTETGARTPVIERLETTLGLSPGSEHMAYWKDGHVWAYDIPADEHTNLTADAPVSFVDAEDDHTGETPPYGVAGWTADGDAVVLNHRHDLYLQPLDGSPATNLTRGAGDAAQMRLRYVRTDPEARFIDLDEPVLLSAFGRLTKKDGFFRLDDGEVEELVYDDARFSGPIKARDADRVLIARETFEVFPDWHATDLSFSALERLTDANPQQADYRWGSRILFDYTNDDGVPLQGTLAIPDGYREGERLPMLVHFYEKLSQNLHDYPAPRYASSPQYAGYVSDGWLVMEPDIHFNTRTSHSDMVESVEAAVQAVIDLGYVDPGAVVLHGHSYSGGGSSYIATQSDIFAAITSGAAPINLRSEFNQIWPGGGGNNHRYDIYGQGRYGTDPYSDLELYLDQSPITHAPTMDTPLLYLHGVEDGTVPWEQGLEWYNGLRFLGKNVIWLSYPGAGHGLRRHDNAKDFQIRMRQFFDHYAKGKPAPRWMTEGRSYLEKERALETNDGGDGGG